jgi:Uncharacterized alpha/beta hydrolase domain (DUF2235)
MLPADRSRQAAMACGLTSESTLRTATRLSNRTTSGCAAQPGEDLVPKNILIFADGTGNESGLLPDESRTNVYKLFRATRTGPDTTVDPKKQIAFYIPGVGTPGVTPPSIWKTGVERHRASCGRRANCPDCRLLRGDHQRVGARRSHLPFRFQSRCILRSMRSSCSGSHWHSYDRGGRRRPEPGTKVAAGHGENSGNNPLSPGPTSTERS